MKTLLVSTMIVFALASAVRADITADVKAHSEAFAKAANACDTTAVMALYDKDATVIWPGEGEEATGQAAIEKLAGDFCKNGKHSLKMEDFKARPLGKNFIVNVGHWEDTLTTADGKSMTAKLRTTEVLKKSGGKWLYVVDHASIGMPPAAAAAASPAAAAPAQASPEGASPGASPAK